MAADIDVLVLGGAGADTVVYVPELPLAFADSYPVPAIETRAGQTGDGVALGLHALGLRTHHVDFVGDDHEGELVRALHRDHGAPFTGLVSAAGTKRAVNLVGPDGRRLSLYDASRSDDADRFPPDMLTGLAARSRHAHVCITQPGQHALESLTATGVTISTDLHDWDGANPYHQVFARQADIVFLSAASVPDIAATMRQILGYGRARTVVATAGAAGSFALTPDEDVPRHFEAVAPRGVIVDSNGAGDAFVAGFLLGHLNGASVETCMKYAAIAGAHACTVPSTEVRPIDRETLVTLAEDVDVTALA